MLCLLGGERRYRSLRSGIPGITDRVLAKRLTELEANGMISRRMVSAKPPQVWYGLTEKGLALRPVFYALAAWKYGKSSAD